MKTKKTNNKFRLNKNTVSNLSLMDMADMADVKGGIEQTSPYYCTSFGCPTNESQWISCIFSCSNYCTESIC